MNRFTLEVIDSGTWVAGDNIHIQVICDEGFADIFLNIVPDYSTLATSSVLDTVSTGISNIMGPDWADETLVTIQAAVNNVTVDTTGLATSTDVTNAITTLQGDLSNISVTVDGTDLVTLDTVITLPSGRTKTFEQVLEDIYKYRKY
jgi:hypothetical protein